MEKGKRGRKVTVPGGPGGAAQQRVIEIYKVDGMRRGPGGLTIDSREGGQ